MGFLARWLSDALHLGLALALALAAMQVPALAHQYTTALLQITEDARRRISSRGRHQRGGFTVQQARRTRRSFAALQAVEPSNAGGARGVGAARPCPPVAYDRIEFAPPLLRPIGGRLRCRRRGSQR